MTGGILQLSFASRCAQEDRNEEINDVEDGVDGYEYHGQVVRYVALDRAKYSKYQEEDC